MSEELAQRVEALSTPNCVYTDIAIARIFEPKPRVDNQNFPIFKKGSRKYTSSIDDTRKDFPYLCVNASDIGADGLALVVLVTDTSTSPVIEHTGIASRLEHAWLAAALRGFAYEKAKG